MLTKGVSIESVSKMLGHTDITTTQIYARITDLKIGEEMTQANEQNIRTIKPKSDMDISFESLSLKGKMALFNLPITLSNDPDRINRISKMWYCLTEEEKLSIWSNSYANERVFLPKNSKSKLVINQ
jgi:hypothetical protein